jgi:hypothetical protein
MRYCSSEALEVHINTHGSGYENLLCQPCGIEFVSEMTCVEDVGTAHSLFPLGRQFIQRTRNEEEERMKEYLDEIRVQYSKQRHVNTRHIPGAGVGVFHDFWIEDEERIIILEVNEFQHKYVDYYPVKRVSTRPLNTFKVLALAGVVKPIVL